MSEKSKYLKPQDILIILRILSLPPLYLKGWKMNDISNSLQISQSEVSESIRRSQYIGLIEKGTKCVFYESFVEFLAHGLRFVFPAKPGAISRGVPTAHSAPPLNRIISANNDIYVWPYAFGTVTGQSIEPLYNTVPRVISEVTSKDESEDRKFYELLALTDALRVGKARERNIAKQEIEKRILANNWN
ncbi:MAG: hypothetical protein K8I03_05690 [Ignavibacteria bacterium]|nr:hypothetical protein [Ignavibacteria bacterium]